MSCDYANYLQNIFCNFLLNFKESVKCKQGNLDKIHKLLRFSRACSLLKMVCKELIHTHGYTKEYLYVIVYGQ